MNDKNKTIQYTLIGVALIVALLGSYFGIKLPVPPIPEPAAGGEVGLEYALADRYFESLIVDKELDVNGTLSVDGAMTMSGALAGATPLVFEGATADAYETTLGVTDPVTDTTATLPNETGAIMMSSLVTNGTTITNSVTGASNALVWEGATADDYELSLTASDPGADVTVTLPAQTGTVMMSTSEGGLAAQLFQAGQDLKYEGTTADEHEGMIRFPAEPTFDVIWELPVGTAADSTGQLMVSTLATNAPSAANSLWGDSNALKFEGATADDYETALTVTDTTTTDKTITLPDATGTVGLFSGATTSVFGSDTITGTLAVTHGLTTPLIALCSMGADPTDDEEDRCTTTISGATVTVKVWKEAATPTAGDSGVTVYWMVAGTP